MARIANPAAVGSADPTVLRARAARGQSRPAPVVRPQAAAGSQNGQVSSRSRFWSGLRVRAALGFGITGLIVAVAGASLTYALARSYLVDQREDTAIRQAYVNARLARNILRAEAPDVRAFLASLGGGTASDSVLQYRGESFATSLTIGPEEIPRDLQRVVGSGQAGHQRYRDAGGNLHLAVGVRLAAVEADYYELFSLAELEDTIELLARSLASGVAGAAAVAAMVGWAAANRLVRPLRPVADAAERIAGGALDTRLAEPADPDLRRLTEAFNQMAAALESRIERETRFAADVSHELRSPLAAVSAAVEIIQRRRDQLPPQVTEAFAVLSAKVSLFRRMVLDLLEISRLDGGTAVMSDDLIDLPHLLDRLVDQHAAAGTPIEVDPDTPTHIRGDRRRLAQAVANILDNANRYAGGVTRVGVTIPSEGWIRLEIDDHGPGISEEERDAVFGRFARGAAGVEAGSDSGTGLGLALTAEHVRLHGGRVWVEDAPDGGARFVIDIPTGLP
jgi:two-component system, OmpR family, sensor histidine kinase MtrB